MIWYQRYLPINQYACHIWSNYCGSNKRVCFQIVRVFSNFNHRIIFWSSCRQVMCMKCEMDSEPKSIPKWKTKCLPSKFHITSFKYEIFYILNKFMILHCFLFHSNLSWLDVKWIDIFQYLCCNHSLHIIIHYSFGILLKVKRMWR